jgi:hypothetical protein
VDFLRPPVKNVDAGIPSTLKPRKTPSTSELEARPKRKNAAIGGEAKCNRTIPITPMSTAKAIAARPTHVSLRFLSCLASSLRLTAKYINTGIIA